MIDTPDKQNNRDTVFYYSREHRLSRASREVQAMNEEPAKRKGFLQSLVGSKSNLMLLLSIVFFMIIIGVVSRVSSGGGVKLGGNTLLLTLVREDERQFLGIVKRAGQSGEVYMGTVDVTVVPAAGKAGELGYRITFNPVESELYRIDFPFTGDDFFVTFEIAGERKTARVKASKR